MKRMTLLIAMGMMLAAGVLAIGMNARADEKEGPSKAGVCKNGPGMFDGKDRGGRWDASARLERMKDKLDLSDEQLAKLKAIREKSKAEGKPLRGKLEKDVQNLSDKLKSGADGGVLKALLDKVYADRKGLGDFREKQMREIREVLTTTQQAKMVAAMGEKSGRMGKAGRKHYKGGKAEKAKVDPSETEQQSASE